MQDAEKQIFQTLKKRCAWCDKEAGRKPQLNDSHGICEYHFAVELSRAGLRQDEIKPMIERIKTGGSPFTQVRDVYIK